MLFVFGLMGWSDVPVYLTMAVMPVLLIAIGVMNDVYLFNRYFSLLRERHAGRHLELLRETFDRLVSPVAITSLTAAIGFGSFAFSPLPPLVLSSRSRPRSSTFLTRNCKQPSGLHWPSPRVTSPWGTWRA